MPVPIQLTEIPILLIDVREPRQCAAGRINGARPFPLSTFDPTG